MAQKIRGKDFVLLLEKDGKNVPVCCGRDLTININVDLIPVTKAPNSRWSDYIAGDIGFSLSSDSIVTIGNGVNLRDVFAKINSRTPFEFVAMANTTQDVFFSGKILITNLSVNGETKNIMTYSLSATGCGELNVENPYEIIFIDGGDGIIGSDDDIPIYYDEHGNLNPIDLETEC